MRKILVKKYLTDFTEYLKKNNYKQATINGYFFGLKDFLNFLNKKNKNIPEISKKDFELTGLGAGQYLFFSSAQQKINFNAHITEKALQDIFNKHKNAIHNSLSIIDLRNSYAVNLSSNNYPDEINSINKHEEIDSTTDFLSL